MTSVAKKIERGLRALMRFIKTGKTSGADSIHIRRNPSRLVLFIYIIQTLKYCGRGVGFMGYGGPIFALGTIFHGSVFQESIQSAALQLSRKILYSTFSLKK